MSAFADSTALRDLSKMQGTVMAPQAGIQEIDLEATRRAVSKTSVQIDQPFYREPGKSLITLYV
jgi:hypothetical protein